MDPRPCELQLVPTTALALPAVPGEAAARLVKLFLSGRTRRTLEAYRDDLDDLRRFLAAKDASAAAAALLSRGHGEANALVLSYRASLLEKKLAHATINRRLAAVRALVKLAKLLGLIEWTIDVPGLKVEKLKDTRGPGPEGVAALLERLERRGDAKGVRDRAVLRLLYDLALRRAEVVSLDLEHLDLVVGTLAVLGKGKAERIKLTLPERTKTALLAWVQERGHKPGPLFTSLDPAKKGSGGITAGSLYRIVRRLGEQAGIRARPHGLRHAAITAALDLTGGDLRASAAFSRHSDWRTLAVYDDARRDLGGEVAKKVSEALPVANPGKEAAKTP